MAKSLEPQMGNLPTGIAAPSKKERAAFVAEDKHSILGRRGPSGELRLRSLTERHLRIIAMHLAGEYTGRDIANEVGCSVAKVYQVLNDPLSKNIIQQFRAGQMEDLHGLLPSVVKAVRDGLTSGSDKIRMAAVDRFVKLTRAETEAAAANRPHDPSVIILDARARFVQTIKDVTPYARELAPATDSVLEEGDSEASS